MTFSIVSSRKGTTFVSVYLVLRQKGDICLLLRQNTGYNDGKYGLISGHVEEGESATRAMVREAYEEGGLILTEDQLRVVHVIHRRSEDRLGIDIFFEANSWSGNLENKEPHKCERLAFFSEDKFPQNTIAYIAETILAIQRKEFYSEEGW